jgi:hypothetical protein
LISKCERRLASTSMFLSQAGRLQITNVVFTALPHFQPLHLQASQDNHHTD